MAHWLNRLAPGVGPLAVLASLAALDRWSYGPAPFAGVLTGMALLGGFLASAWWGRQRLAPLPQALQAALRSACEGALGVVLVFLLVAPLTVLLPQPWVVQLLRDDRATDLLTMLILGVGLVVAGRAMVAAIRQAARTATAERDAANTRAELAERDRELARAELQVLQAQVEPHFLWNTLANVEYLIRKDPPQAGAMMGHLITYLRSSVPDGRRATTTLGSEFASLRAYLGLMQFRMGERFQFELSLDPELVDEPFPPLVLQTMVENALKHGVEPKVGPVWVNVSAELAGDQLQLVVSDNGVGIGYGPSGNAGSGTGLKNIRERLAGIYEGRASLSVNSLPEGGVAATVHLDLRQPIKSTTLTQLQES